MSESAAERIGDFRVLGSLRGGSGAQGAVCRAVCEGNSCPGVLPGEVVAIKTMPVADENGRLFAKLKHRTDVLSGLDHPNVVRYRGCFSVVDAFTSLHVVVMECLDGETLRDRLAANPSGLDADEALRIVQKSAAGLAAACSAGLIHRDVKPSNIFLCRDGSVKVIDFELARGETTTTASSGRFLGTFDYMAPEFADATFRGDETSDVFSLGVVLHEALCGRTPYANGKSGGRQADFDFLSRWSDDGSRQTSLQPSARATRLLSGMKDVLTKALAPDRAARFATFAEMLAALGQIRYREFRNGERHYRLLKQVGKGGFGEVFKARMSPGDRLVAVKHLMRASYGDRFRREARIMQRFHDSCFTQFIDYFEVNRAGTAEAYLVMDYLPEMPGSSLRDAIRAAAPGRLRPDEVIAAFARYAHGLSVLHAGQVYHRDIKPSNLYFLAGRSDRAVIMDMGIARDAGGSVTAGDVPGTLDYMPPEIVTKGSRGDARMDIYALGLCFYEALTGRQGFARLPSGADGLVEFYRRSRAARPPVLTDAEIVRRPAVLNLIRRMTDPDVSRRLGDAAELERMLLSLDWDATAAFVPSDVPSASSESEPVSDDGPRTRQTSETGRQRPEPRSFDVEAVLRQMVRWGAVAMVLGAFAIGVMLLRRPISSSIEKFRNWQVERQVAEERSVAAARAAAAAEAADSAERAANAKEAGEEATGIVADYERSLSSATGDARLSEWETRWRRRKLPEGWFERQSSELSVARENCLGRMNDRRIISEREADAVNSDYLNAKDVAVPDALAAAWADKWATNGIPSDSFVRQTNQFAQAHVRCADRIRRQAEQAAEAAARREKSASRVKAARSDAEKLIADYARTDVLKAKVDSEYAGWSSRWSDLAANPELREIDRSIRAAQEERRRADQEAGVVAECRALFGNIWAMTSDNVRNWHDNLDRAVIEMKKASRSGRLSAAGRGALEREIASMRRWQVGVIDNKTHETLSFMGRKIGPISESLFVLTNGLPDHAAIICGGYEPVRVSSERFDGHAFVVMKKDLVRMAGTSELEIPQLAEGVVCIVDGLLCESGRVRLPPGKHTCIYRNTRETTSGVRDCLDQKDVVVTTEGELTRLRPPDANWAASPEGLAARENAVRASKGESLAAAVEKAFETLPIETRRARLEKAFSILSNWQTPSLLGQRTMDRLKARYETERQRVVGRVVNGLEKPLRVKVQERWIVIRPGDSAIVSYDDGSTSDARIAVAGYDYLFLPSPAAFDGRDFVVAPEQLVPTPVMVTVPDLGEGVECRLAGELIRETVERKPGSYICVYSRSGYADQRRTVEVKVGEDLTLPNPGKWEPVGMFGRIVDAVKDASDSTARGLKSATETIGTIERKETK